jgi:hypothetical protein
VRFIKFSFGVVLKDNRMDSREESLELREAISADYNEAHHFVDMTGEVALSEKQTNDVLRRASVAKPESKYASAGSVAVIGLVTFVGDCARGLIYPALWPLCQQLGGTRVDLGWLIATFSIGRLIISSRLGIFADVYRHRLALILSCGVLSLGAIIWAFSPKLGGLYTLYAGQFIMGVGTGLLREIYLSFALIL